MADSTSTVRFDGMALPVRSMNTLVIGSGAAGLAAALRLFDQGQRDVVLATEKWGAGTSFNAGSDKQTYYKLSLAGDRQDSPYRMAEDLFRCGSMHGDIALCEAQHSAQAFFRLVELGVPFPHDRYGAFAGYRTDHDRCGRATSAGPLTSHLMARHLGEALRARGVPVIDNHPVVALLCEGKDRSRRVRGAVALDRRRISGDDPGFVIFNAENVILATGGPGGLYADSVYPRSQTGSIGLALAAGAEAQNLTESQFGLASVGFRWNVSGSYQQVIPRYVATDPDGGNEREFLSDVFPSMEALTGAIFRKGYEWPFDAAKVAGFGSSLIDLLVFRETVKRGRRVFLDYTRNPGHPAGRPAFSLDRLDKESRGYLEKSNALLPLPIDRLESMNPQAAALFRDHGIDLRSDRLEIAVCAQHCNGGLKGNIWWESNIRHLFPVGEVNGTHGVCRPGGSALNSGQVGALRAALYIARRCANSPVPPGELLRRTGSDLRRCLEFARNAAARGSGAPLTPGRVVDEVRRTMSDCAAHIREPEQVARALSGAWALNERLHADLGIDSFDRLPEAFRAADLCLTHAVFLEAIDEYLVKGGQSRGSCLVLDRRGEAVCPGLGSEWSYSCSGPDDVVNSKILEIRLDSHLGVERCWVDVRPLPCDDLWFESLWRDYVNDRVIDKEE